MPVALDRRRRTRLTWLLLFALLFQQFALAAHACDLEVPASAPAPTSELDHCGDAQAAGSHDMDALCLKHCMPDQATAHDLVAAKVPAMLPAILTLAARLPPSVGPVDLGVAPPAAGPPPLQRSCTLLL